MLPSTRHPRLSLNGQGNGNASGNNNEGDPPAQTSIEQQLAFASVLETRNLPTAVSNPQVQHFMPFAYPPSANLTSANAFALSQAQQRIPNPSTVPIGYSAFAESYPPIYPAALAQLLASSRLDMGMQVGVYSPFQHPQPGLPALMQPASLPLRVDNNLPLAVASTTPVPPSVPFIRRCKTLYLDQDEDNLSPYQCLGRKQIEVFEATERDLQDNAQGRNRKIHLAQVGIRCRHCGTMPAKGRAKGAVFFPSRLVGVYQTGQNMTNTHLVTDCKSIPRDVRQDLVGVRLKEKGAKTRKSAYGGGQHYWAACLRVQGVIETPDRRLRFAFPGEC